MNHNHSNYQKRLDFIHDLLSRRFSFKDLDIETIAHEPDRPFKYNNFVYKLTLATPTAVGQHGQPESLQPCTVPIPAGTTELIMRLANPDAEDMNKTNRVENEVAIISLASRALDHHKPSIVPSVYGWGSAAAPSSQGWILQQMMPGSPVDLDKLDTEHQKVVLSQMAGILSALQKAQLPASVTGFGGLTIDARGQIVSAPMTTVDAGPWPSYQDSFTARFQIALEKADASPYIKGWQANGVRTRIEAFIRLGLSKQFQALNAKGDKCIIHGDFASTNILFDATSQRLTALLDYDFSCISHPSHEFLQFFDGSLGWSGGEDEDELALKKAKLHGFPSPLPESSQKGVNWIVSKTWDDELEKIQISRPRTIAGIESVADVDGLLRGILPWRLSNPDVLQLQSEDAKAKHTKECEERLVEMLDRLGF